MVPEVIHPVQYGITPKRLLSPHSVDKILSGIDEDVSSIRDGYTAWAISDPSATLERHLASKESAKPTCRDANERRHYFSPSPLPPAKILLRQQRAQPRTRADAYKHILDPEEGGKRPLKSTLQVNGTLLRCRKRPNTFNKCLRTTFILPISLDVLSCSIRTRFTRTSKSSPSRLVPKDTAQWQVLLYQNVAPHQQPSC